MGGFHGKVLPSQNSVFREAGRPRLQLACAGPAAREVSSCAIEHDVMPVPIIGPLPVAEPQLSIVAARLERLTDPAAFFDPTRSRSECARGPERDHSPSPANPRGFGHELRWGLRAGARGVHHHRRSRRLGAHGLSRRSLGARGTRRNRCGLAIRDGSRVEMPAARRVGSRLLNPCSAGSESRCERRVERVGCTEPMSCNALRLEATDYDILQEVLVARLAAGWRVLEIPLLYRPTGVASKAHASLASAYFAPSGRSGSCAIRSRQPTMTSARTTARFPLQRYWQRRRFRHVIELIDGQGPCSTSDADRAGSSARCRGQRRARRPRRTSCGSRDGFGAARQRLGLRAAVCGRELPVRALLAGH